MLVCSPHPDAVVETASLAAVAPPRPNYALTMPTDEKCGLSSLQLETVVYACMRHETLIPDASGQGFVRAGFYLGDGCVNLIIEHIFSQCCLYFHVFPLYFTSAVVYLCAYTSVERGWGKVGS